MTDRKNQKTDPSVDPQAPTERLDVDSLNRARHPGRGFDRDDLDSERDPAGAESIEQVTHRGPRNVEGL